VSGNVTERIISVEIPSNRLFTDVNDDGNLDSNGNVNQSAWPISVGLRGE